MTEIEFRKEVVEYLRACPSDVIKSKSTARRLGCTTHRLGAALRILCMSKVVEQRTRGKWIINRDQLENWKGS